MKSFIDFITEAAGLKRVDSTHYIHPSGLHLVQKDDKTWSVYHPDPENPSQPDYYGKEQSVKHRNKQSAIRSASMHYRLHMKPAKITEETQRQYTEFGPRAFKTRSQMTAIAKMPDFQVYCKPHDYISNNKILVRPDDSKHFADTRYFIANQQQEFMMRVDVSERGKIYGWVVYRRDHEHEKDSGVQMSWVIQKTGGEV